MKQHSARLLGLWVVGFALPSVLYALDWALVELAPDHPLMALLAYVPWSGPFVVICALAIWMADYSRLAKVLLIIASAIGISLHMFCISLLSVIFGDIGETIAKLLVEAQ